MIRVIFVLVLFLHGCSSAPQRTLPPVIDGTRSETSQGDAPVTVHTPEQIEMPVASPVPAGDAVIALLERAETYHQSGDISNEAATIERALRIDPNNAHLWNRLATVRLDQGQPRQALQLPSAAGCCMTIETGAAATPPSEIIC